LLKDATLETTNEAYAERIGQVRGQEQVCKILKDLHAKLSGNDGGNDIGKSDLVSALRTAQEALGKIERTKDSKGNSLYYESTAIVDAIGAIEMADEISLATALVHVIKKLSEETEMRLSQLGSGKAIIQSSKYLERLLDATRLLKEKDVFQDAGDLNSEIQEHLDLQSDVKGQLIAARKGNLTMLPLVEGELVDKEEQRRAFACDIMKKKLKVNSVAGLSKKYVKFGVKVNAAARKTLSKK